jgi:hypothetical protein
MMPESIDAGQSDLDGPPNESAGRVAIDHSSARGPDLFGPLASQCQREGESRKDAEHGKTG